MEAIIFLIAFLISAVVIGYLTRAVAKDKGHDGTDWFWGGFLLGPLGLLAAAGLSDRKLRNYIRQIGESKGAKRLWTRSFISLQKIMRSQTHFSLACS